MKHSKLVHSIVFFLLVGGCQSALNLTKQASDFQSLIACEQAAVVLTDKGNTDTPVQKKYKRSECPECHGTGFIVSGDGLFKQECPYCEANASSSSPQACECGKCACKKCECKKGENCCCAGGQDCSKYNTEAIQLNSNKKCCQDCICGQSCKCTYAGECLVKRNGGKPAKVCDQNSCRQYSAPAQSKPTTQKYNKPSQTYMYSNGCSSGGWGSSSGGGRRSGFGGRGIF